MKIIIGRSFEIEAGFRGAYFKVPFIGSVWIDTTSNRPGQEFIIETHENSTHKTVELWFRMLYIIWDRPAQSGEFTAT